jgi:uncharacterized membrane protein
MSDGSQKPAKRRLGFATRFALLMAGVFVLIALAMGPVASDVLRLATQARLKAPNMNVWNDLSPAIQVHVITAVIALLLGAALMIIRKGRTFHRTAGWVWVSLVSVTAGSSLFITSLNHGKWSLLHLLTGWTLIALPLAVIAARRHSVVRHRRTMMGLFYGGFAINLFIAFIPGRSMWVMFFG